MQCRSRDSSVLLLVAYLPENAFWGGVASAGAGLVRCGASVSGRWPFAADQPADIMFAGCFVDDRVPSVVALKDELQVSPTICYHCYRHTTALPDNVPATPRSVSDQSAARCLIFRVVDWRGCSNARAPRRSGRVAALVRRKRRRPAAVATAGRHHALSVIEAAWQVSRCRGGTGDAALADSIAVRLTVRSMARVAVINIHDNAAPPKRGSATHSPLPPTGQRHHANAHLPPAG